MTDGRLTETVASDPETTDPAEKASARRTAIIRAVLVGGYLFVVFGILLPRVVDYRDVIAAFRAVPPEWLLVVVAIGVASWVAEGLSLNALLPVLGVFRSTVAWLSMAAVGSTVPGPVKMAFGYRLFRGWDISPEMATLGLTLNGLATQASKLLLPAVACPVPHDLGHPPVHRVRAGDPHRAAGGARPRSSASGSSAPRTSRCVSVRSRRGRRTRSCAASSGRSRTTSRRA